MTTSLPEFPVENVGSDDFGVAAFPVFALNENEKKFFSILHIPKHVFQVFYNEN